MNITDEIARQICNLYKKGEKVADIVMTVGCSKSSVLRALDKSGLRNTARKLVDEKDVNQIRRLAKTCTLREIVIKTGMSFQTVRGIIARYWVAQKKISKRYSPEEDSYILENMNVKTIHKIATHLNRTDSAIYSRLKQLRKKTDYMREARKPLPFCAAPTPYEQKNIKELYEKYHIETALS